MKGDLWLWNVYIESLKRKHFAQWYLYTNINLHTLIGIISYSYTLKRNFSLSLSPFFFNAAFHFLVRKCRPSYRSTKRSRNKNLHDVITMSTSVTFCPLLLYLTSRNTIPCRKRSQTYVSNTDPFAYHVINLRIRKKVRISQRFCECQERLDYVHISVFLLFHNSRL